MVAASIPWGFLIVAQGEEWLSSNSNDFTLLVGRTTYNNGAYAGTLADVRIYNDLLADSDIAAIAASPP